jgi:hypothetical protein
MEQESTSILNDESMDESRGNIRKCRKLSRPLLDCQFVYCSDFSTMIL